jgi:hypothetical protein
MAFPTVESESGAIQLDFDRRLMAQFRGSVTTSNAGWLGCRELNDAFGLTAVAGDFLADARTGRTAAIAAVSVRAAFRLRSRSRRIVARHRNDTKKLYVTLI